MVNFLTRIALALVAVLALAPISLARADGPASGSLLFDSSTHAVRTQSWIEEWDPYVGRWVRSEEQPSSTSRAVAAASAGARTAPLRVFGPFVVLDASTAAVFGPTNAESPSDFARMRAAFPAISMLQLIDAPGTVQDIANLEVGRMIRAAGISTHVPANGSVRSGAVELFLAGKTRTMEPGARFAVHSWRDERGRGPQDFAPDDPVNRLYISFYEEMGMSRTDATAFYDMTNSVPNSRALWFGPEVMRTWVAKQDAIAPRTSTGTLLAFDPTLLSQYFAPLDNPGFTPTIRFARSPQVPFAVPQERSAFAGI